MSSELLLITGDFNIHVDDPRDQWFDNQETIADYQADIA